MSEWKEVFFNDFIKLNRGFDLPNDQIQKGLYPVVASTSIKAYHCEFKVLGEGVITGRSGSLGRVQYVRDKYWPLNTALYVKDFKGNVPKFVYYFLSEMHLENFDSGSGVPTLNQNHLHKLKIKIPNLKTQEKIANILGTYDELIEVNNERIKILEETAQSLYKEWFVRFRFPNYQNTEIIKGVPKGWEVVELKSITKITMGQSPKSEFYNETGKGLPFHQGVGSYGDRFPNHETFCNVSGRLANKGDILFSVRAPVGRLNIADKQLIIGRGLSAIRHLKELNNYLFYMLKSEFVNEDIIGNGSIFNSVTRNEIETFKVNYSEEIAKEFDNFILPIDAQIQTLQQQNTELRQIRDRLLPRLISGKLVV